MLLALMSIGDAPEEEERVGRVEKGRGDCIVADCLGEAGARTIWKVC